MRRLAALSLAVLALASTLLAACGKTVYVVPEEVPAYADSVAPKFSWVDPPADPTPFTGPQHALSIRVAMASAVTAFGYAANAGDALTWLPVNWVASGDWWTLPVTIPNPPLGPLYVRAMAGNKCYEALIDFQPLVNEGWTITVGDLWEARW